MGLRRFGLVEMRVHVAAPGEDVDDLNPLAGIAEEDNVTLFGNGPDVGAKFRACRAECTGQGREACSGGAALR